MKFVAKHISKKALSCILALCLVVCSVSAVFSVFATTEDGATPDAPYTVRYSSPAIPMFVGKTVAFKDLAVDFSSADGDTVAGDSAEITWAIAEGDNVLLMDDCIYAMSAGKTKLTATYGSGESAKTQNVWVIVNGAGDYNFILVDVDFENGDTIDGDNWIQARSIDTTDNGISDSDTNKNRLAASTTGFFSRPTSNVVVTTSGGETYLQLKGNLAQDCELFYTAPILSDFADYTLDVETKVTGYNGDRVTEYLGFTVRANVNFNVASYDTSNPPTTLSSSYNVFRWFNDDGSVAQVGTGMYFRQRFNGAVLLGNYNDLNEDGYNGVFGALNLGTESLPLHSLSGDDWKKTLGYKGTAADADYTINPTVYYDGTNTNATRRRNISISLSGIDVLYSIDNNVILDTTKQIYQVSGNSGFALGDTVTLVTGSTKAGDLTNAAYSRETYEEKFETAGVSTAGNAIGFGTSQMHYNIYNFQVKVNGVSADTMPAMSDPDFYIVDDANPVIPMIAGYKLSTSDFMMRIDGAYYSVSDFSWTDGSETTAEIKDGYLYSYSKGGTVLNGTLLANSDITAKLYVVAKEQGDTEYTVYSNDYRSTLSETGVSDWKTVIVNNKDDDTGIDVSGNYAAEQYLKGFVPYNYSTVKTDSDLTNTYDTSANRSYTLLDNEIVNSLTDYKITASFKMYTGYRGAIGVVGRVSDTTDGKYTAGSSKTYGFATSGSNSYTESFKKVHTVNANTLAEASDISADLKNYLHDSVTATGYAYRTFVVEFKDDTATLSAPGVDGTATLADVPAQAGQVGFVAMFSRNDDKTTPVLMDFSVTLTNVNDDAVLANLIANGDEVVKKTSGYVDNENYVFPNFVSYDGNNTGVIPSSNNDANKGIVLTKPYPESITFPTTISDVKIYSTGHYLYRNKTTDEQRSLCEAIIPEGYTQVDDSTFTNCSFLEYVSLPETMTSIGEGAFASSGMVSVKLPANVTTIKDIAFQTSYSLRYVTLNEGLETIGASAFKSCYVLEDVSVPSTVTEIGNTAFADCNSLDNIYINGAATVIGTSAIPATTVIHGYIGSYAHAYAIENGNEFVALDELTVNSRYELPAVEGFTWTANETAIGAVVVNDTATTVVGLSEGTLTVNGTYTYTAADATEATTVDVAVTLKVGAYDATADNFATDDFAIDITGTNGEYILTVNTNYMKHNTLKINDKFIYLDEFEVENELPTGYQFVMKDIDLATVTIAAEFETDENIYKTNVYGLGATARTTEGKEGLRFTFRTPTIVPNVADSTKGAISNVEYVIDGKTVTVTDIGALMLPTALLKGNTLDSFTADDINSGLAGNGLKLGQYSVAQIDIKYISDLTYDYADFNATLTGIAEGMESTDITCVAYAIYQYSDGETTQYGVIYSNQLNQSYTGVLEAAQ